MDEITRSLVRYINSHGCPVRISAAGLSIGIIVARRGDDGAYTLETEWSKPLQGLTAIRRELGY